MATSSKKRHIRCFMFAFILGEFNFNTLCHTIRLSNEIDNISSEISNDDKYYMTIASIEKDKGEDNRTQVGACVVGEDGTIVSVGHNNMPEQGKNLPWLTRKESSGDIDCKHSYVCHAEMNAIMNAGRVNLRNCKIYVTMHPCEDCASLIIQSGIDEVIFLNHSRKGAQRDVKAEEMLKRYMSLRRYEGTIQMEKTENRAVNRKYMNETEKHIMRMVRATQDYYKTNSACIVDKSCKIQRIAWDLEFGRHAEMVAIMSVANLENSAIYISSAPCIECTKLIVQAGIKKVVYADGKLLESSKLMFDCTGVQYWKFTVETD